MVDTVEAKPCPDRIVVNEARRLKNAADKVGSITTYVNDTISNIENETNCDNLKQLITVPQVLTDHITAANEQLQKLADFIPLLTFPTSPKKLLGKFKKLVIGTIAPQLEAYIDLTQQIIALSQASVRLLQAVDETIPRIQQCAIDTVNEQIYGLQSSLNKGINSVIIKLTNNINDQLCDLGPTLTELGVTLNDAAVSTQQVVLAGRSIADQADASIATTLNTINTIGSSLQQIAPITFNIDTSSAEAFNESIANGAFDEFKQSTTDFLNLVLPTNTSPPTVTGTVQLGQTLTVSTGTWEGDPSFSYQWYRNQVPIVGANQTTYVLAAADGNQSVITVEVIGTNQNGDDIAEPSPITTTFVTGGLFSFGQRV